MGQVAALLGAPVNGDVPETPLDALRRALEQSGESDLTKAWLGLVAASGRYPDEETVRAEARLLRSRGADQFVDHLTDIFEESVRAERARDAVLDVLSQAVVIDVTHTVQHDLLTGIQRVVRETCSRWIDKPASVGVWWDETADCLRRIDADEADRFREWRDHMPSSHGTTTTRRSLDHSPTAIVIPWKSILLVPELAADVARTNGYRALSCTQVLHGISMIGYDLIPVTAAETVTQGMSQVFNVFLAMVKRTTRLSAISEAAADDFRAFNGALRSQGLTGPLIESHLLPPSPPDLSQDDLDEVRESLALGALPMVVVVGSHEPRKNHLTVLDAAERLWSSGLWFDLVFIGGSSWGAQRFDHEVDRLMSIGRPVKVLKRATEAQLWAAYRLARFSVFPSLIEGYGLPIVESMASGTPVITTNYGSMAEVAVGGGALLVDPYDARGHRGGDALAARGPGAVGAAPRRSARSNVPDLGSVLRRRVAVPGRGFVEFCDRLTPARGCSSTAADHPLRPQASPAHRSRTASAHHVEAHARAGGGRTSCWRLKSVIAVCRS